MTAARILVLTEVTSFASAPQACLLLWLVPFRIRRDHPSFRSNDFWSDASCSFRAERECYVPVQKPTKEDSDMGIGVFDTSGA